MNDTRLVYKLRKSANSVDGHDFTDEEMKSVPESCVSLELENSAVTNQGIHNLPDLPSLRCLDLDSTVITDEAMKIVSSMVSLEELWIEDTKITDAGFLLLSELPRISFVSILDCNISDDAIARFRVKRPDVQIH